MVDPVWRERFPKARFYDVTESYADFVAFTANAVYPIHRWYRFKEGFSRDLVHLVVGSLGIKVENCLDPFAGSGTTPLACEEIGIRCHSIEVNPFLHKLARVKLGLDYTVEGLDRALEEVQSNISTIGMRRFSEPVMSTITERPGLDKWLFSEPVLQAVLGLRQSLNSIEPVYADLLLVVLASILTDVGNTVKDGKCVRYKKDWSNLRFDRKDVWELFFRRAEVFREDVQYAREREWKRCDNAALCMRGNAIEMLDELADQSIDLVITSPPYLNSFDYTDVYMPELWALGFVKNYEEVRQLRSSTIRSHVQSRWKVNEENLEKTLKALIPNVVDGRQDLWNDSIPSMIYGYFSDMKEILRQLKRIVRESGKVCIIVGASSYYNVTLHTDILLASIAEEFGFELEEMRIVRKLKRSSKQATNNGKRSAPLRESLLILSSST